MPKVVYYIENDENTLSHYGRLGMKWGQHIFEKRAARASKRLRKYTKKANKIADDRDKVVARNKATTYMLANSVLRDHEINKGRKSELTKMLESNVESGRKEAAKLQRKGLHYIEKAKASGMKLEELESKRKDGKTFVDELVKK